MAPPERGCAHPITAHSFIDLERMKGWVSISLTPTPRRRGSPGMISVKFSVDVNELPIPNDVETLPKISTGWVGRTNVTDDRQTVATDGRATAYSSCSRSLNLSWLCCRRNCVKIGSYQCYVTLYARTDRISCDVIFAMFDKLVMLKVE